MPAGTLEMGRDSSAGVGFVTGPMVAEASASEKFSDKESLTSDSGAMTLLFKEVTFFLNDRLLTDKNFIK